MFTVNPSQIKKAAEFILCHLD